MALKFLNKKGWHTGSLRNLETVWKAEQKHEAEQKKLEELRAQLHKERESEEFRQQLHAAGLAPKQERLEFLYDSGLGVGGGASSNTKSLTAEESKGALDSGKKDDKRGQPAAEKPAQVVPGALFSDSNSQSANDKWRKIHSDPLFLIKQQELAARERIRKNPVKMQMLESQVRKTMEPEKRKSKAAEDGSSGSRHRHKKRKNEKKEKDKGERQKKEKFRREERAHRKKRKYDSEDDSGYEKNDFPKEHVANGISRRSHREDSPGQGNYGKNPMSRNDRRLRNDISHRSCSDDYADQSDGKGSRLRSRRDDTIERPHRSRRSHSEDYSDQSYGKDSRLKSRRDDIPERPQRPHRIHRDDNPNQSYGKDSWQRSHRVDILERPHRPHRGHSEDYSDQIDAKDSWMRSRRTDSPERSNRGYSPATKDGNTFAERRRRHDSPD